MKKAIIFDFDGTIAETMNLVIDSYNVLAQKYGLERIKKNQIESLKNSGPVEVMKKFEISPITLIKLVKDVRSKMKSGISEVEIFPGMENVFEKLKKENWEIGIVTSNSVENVEIFLRKNNIEGFDYIHSENSFFGKSKSLNKIIRNKKYKRENVFYVGDEVRDIEAAKKSGIKIISVTWGLNSKDRLKKTNPTYLVSRPKEILEAVGAKGIN